MSLRKRYPAVSAERSEAPVASTPTMAASPPPVAADTKPPEEIAEKKPSAVDEAANLAIKTRLAEIERAEALARGSAVHERSVESRPPEQTAQTIPPHVQEWLNKHPQYLNDALAQAELHVAAMKSTRDGKTWHDPDFIPTVERYLGLQPPPQTKTAPTNGHVPVSAPTASHNPAPAAPARNAAPPRQYVGPTLSAPPTRESPSMSTGKPVGRPIPLTADELAVARNSGLTPQQYADQKERMLRLRQQGAIQ
jgi:hypothetical protein